MSASDCSTSYWSLLGDDEELLLPLSGEPLLSSQEALPLPPLSEPYLLGYYQGRPWWVAMVSPGDAPQAWQWLNLRSRLGLWDEQAFALAGAALQRQHFLATHRFCGVCGEPTQASNNELATFCPACEHRTYPRISPCVIVAIVKGRQILLAKHRRHQASNLFTVLAGFGEIGETLEQTLKREVQEEVGIEVAGMRYIGSQPWPFPHSLMMGFIANYQAGEIKVDDSELIEADWFDFDALPDIPLHGTIARQLIETLRAELS